MKEMYVKASEERSELEESLRREYEEQKESEIKIVSTCSVYLNM